MNWTAIGAFLLGLAVMLGAFGAHALRNRLDAYAIGVYERAVFYHFIHALGLLVVSILPKSGLLGESGAAWVCGLLLTGVVIFCGSLYALATTGQRALGAITPLGGISFIAAWLILAFHLARGGSGR